MEKILKQQKKPSVFKAVFLSCILVFACQFIGAPAAEMFVTAKEVERIEFSTLPSNVQVMLNQATYADYGDDMKVSVAKNERESVQMIVRPNRADIKRYQVHVGNLKNENGDVLKRENINIHVAKYIHVKLPTTGIFMPGYYPDALVPYDKIREAGEDRIKKGANQSFWFEVDAPADQPGGIYTGDVYFVMNNEKILKKLTVEVFDFALPEEITPKSSFLIWEDMLIHGHKEVTEELLFDYYEFMIEYKTPQFQIPTLLMKGSAKEQAEMLIKYIQRPEIPSTGLPYRVIRRVDSRIPGYEAGMLDLEHMESLLVELAKLSTDSENYLDKLYLHMTNLDEADASGSNSLLMQTVAWVNQDFTRLKDKVAEMPGLLTNKPKVKKSLQKIQFVHTQAMGSFSNLSKFYMDRDPDSPNYGHGIDTWCMVYQGFSNLTDSQARIAAGDGMWAYGCVQPKHPFPTYHLDDYLVSPRTVGWYMKNFNIEGNLYWGSAHYGKYTGEYYPRDVWGDPNLFTGANGDGYVLYPGERYGLSVLPTQRLMNIRDGNEDYEYLALLEKEYNAIAQAAGNSSYDFNTDMGRIYQLVYDKTGNTSGINKYYKDGLGMNYARKQLAYMLGLASDGIMFTYRGNTVNLYAKDGAVVKSVDGVQVTQENKGSTTLYSRTATSKNPVIKYEVGGVTKTVKLYMAGGEIA